MAIPDPTLILRLTHIDNLPILLQRGGLHAPNSVPNDGVRYKTIHNLEIQAQRRVQRIPCGPSGTIHDYVPFYFGERSPMLYQLHTGRVAGYNEGQEALIYLVSTAQRVQQQNLPFVFSDGHGIAAFTRWFATLAELDQVDWKAVKATYWQDTVEDMDRQRRKQAEFLIYRFCPWSLLLGIAVHNEERKAQAEAILQNFPMPMRFAVKVRRDWYYKD
jgi:hypothetical protein